jgi:HAD superfamily hydrolase (TIGR01509 family)
VEPAGILLDVDGTLVDSNYLHTLAWSRALRGAGEWAPMNAIHRLVGMGGEHLLPELLGPDEAEPLLERIRAARKEEYQELVAETEVMPGARELIRGLHDVGLVVVLATSAPRAELDAVVEQLDVGDAVHGATSADDVGGSKPSPDVFRAALEAGGLEPSHALVVGDSVWDVHAARAAGVGCVAVESGGFSAHELSEAGSLHVYRDVEELSVQFRTGPIGHLVSMVRR